MKNTVLLILIMAIIVLLLPLFGGLQFIQNILKSWIPQADFWYGYMTYVGAILAVFTALFIVKWQSFIDYKKYIKENNEYFLTSFYNPICSLLLENSKLYSNFGPETFSKYDMDKRAESGELWESIKEKAIIPNLNSIRELLMKYQYFYINSKILKTYSDLQLHCIAFTLYNDNPNEMYWKYKFNPEWGKLIENDRKEHIERSVK